MIAARNPMNPPEKPLTDAEIDAIYGLEPVIGVESTAGMDSPPAAEFVMVHCPYCGEAFETRRRRERGLRAATSRTARCAASPSKWSCA